MGKTDTVTKDYTNNCEIMADAFNVYMYEGEQVIDPAKLHPMDSTEIAMPYGVDGKTAPVQKYRDGLKYLTAMEDENAVYLLLGIENQVNVHMAMPVRDMLYDALQYAGQVEKVAKAYRSERKKLREEEEAELVEFDSVDAEQEVVSEGAILAEHDIAGAEWEEKPEEAAQTDLDAEAAGEAENLEKAAKKAMLRMMDSAEYLSGFRREDRLVPVVTLVLHFGSEPWDGPMTLHEMFKVQDPKILSMVADYRINLLSPANMLDEEIDRFVTSLREVMLCAKYGKDDARLTYMFQNDKRFKDIDSDAMEVINKLIGTEIEVDRKEKKVNMSEGVRKMLENAKQEGMQEGIQLGERQGIQRGIREIARKMLMRGKYSREEIAEETLLSSAEVQALAAELGV